ncbi:MAG: FtsX-like permease family protein [Candidatus Paceibacterota bacterium]|jgi:putative ABC transport system permease protein
MPSLESVKTAFFIAYKSIVKGNRSTSALLIFVLSLSFLELMFITGILGGLTNGIVQTVVNTSTSHIEIMPQEEPTVKNYIEHQEELRRDIEAIPGVIATARHYTLGGSFSYDKEKSGKFKTVSAQIYGIDPDQEKKVSTIADYIIDGKYLDGLSTDEILLGAGLAGGYGLPQPNDLGGVRAGDKVQVAYSNGIVRSYTVKGVYNVVIGTITNAAFITSKEADSILSTYNEASEVLVKVDQSGAALDKYVSEIKKVAPNLVVKKYTDIISIIGTLLDAFDLISYIVSIISIVVAAITIFVLIYVSAVNKRRQIGILKAIGIKENTIVLSYVFQSLFYAVCGIIVGLVLLFGILSPAIREHPLRLPFGNVYLVYTGWRVVISVISLLLAGFFGGLIPARIVARENILKAIWG